MNFQMNIPCNIYMNNHKCLYECLCKLSSKFSYLFSFICYMLHSKRFRQSVGWRGGRLSKFRIQPYHLPFKLEMKFKMRLAILCDKDSIDNIIIEGGKDCVDSIMISCGRESIIIFCGKYIILW